MRRLGLRVLLGLVGLLLAAGVWAQQAVWLDSLDMSGATIGWGTLHKNASVQGTPLTIAGKVYDHGIGTHAKSRILLDIGGACTRFTAAVGIDDEVKQYKEASVEFRVLGDGKTLWESGIMKATDPAKLIDVDVTRIRILALVVGDGGDSNYADHADWADARLTGSALPPTNAITLLGLPTTQPTFVRPTWGTIHYNESLSGGDLKIGNRTFGSGIGTAAKSDIIYTGLRGRYAKFESWIGVDAGGPGKGAVVFKVFVDSVPRYESVFMSPDTPPIHISIPIEGAREIRLTTFSVDADASAHVDWADAEMIAAAAPVTKPVAKVKYRLQADGPGIELSANGEILGILRADGSRIPYTGRTALAGCFSKQQQVIQSPDKPQRVEFMHWMVDEALGIRFFLVESFEAQPHSILWRISLRGREDIPWGGAIQTELSCADPSTTRIWAPWGDSDPKRQSGWSDPLIPAPFADKHWWYGNPPYRSGDTTSTYTPWRYDTICFPMVTMIDSATSQGLSLIMSPKDYILDMGMQARADGSVTFTRWSNRVDLKTNAQADFTMELVPHEADPRAALAAFVDRYPEYFKPHVPIADEIIGTGAYSGYQGNLDAEKMRKMDFHVNWQASFEFPYMGMFLAPVKDGEEWRNFKGEMTSYKILNDYYKRMRDQGYYVLSYFNCTEFGADIKYPPPPRKAKEDADLWKDANDYLYQVLDKAILPGPDGNPIGSWCGAVVMDPGEPVYEKFLLEQAQRHLDKTPYMYGITIDRSGWLCLYNMNRDDGVSWVMEKPARSLLLSWRNFAPKLAKLMHDAGKVIYLNDHLKRIENIRWMDGIFDEGGDTPGCANESGLMCLRKPCLVWTADESGLKPDPDAFFQRMLHMGVFPMAPFPANDHSINPNEWAEKYYMDYGALLNALHGKKWVLIPNVVQVVGSAKATVNIFETPKGYVIPITFGGAGRVDVKVTYPRKLDDGSKLTCEMIVPGSEEWHPLEFARDGQTITFAAPLTRGCAVVRIQ